jgi:hypothetical protein
MALILNVSRTKRERRLRSRSSVFPSPETFNPQFSWKIGGKMPGNFLGNNPRFGAAIDLGRISAISEISDFLLHAYALYDEHEIICNRKSLTSLTPLTEEKHAICVLCDGKAN